MKQFLSRYFHIIFIGIFFIVTSYLSVVSPLWADENVYLELAQLVLIDSLRPINENTLRMLSWVPHPPFGWYLFAAFSFMPRIASVLTSALCVFFLYHVSKKLCGEGIAKLSTVSLISTWGYMLYSAVAHLDGPLTAFMTISVLSFLAWIRLEDYKYLIFCGLSLGVASLTKYTAAPILLGTFIIWLLLRKRKLNLSMFFKTIVILTVSLIPVALWAYSLSQVYGDFVGHYSEIYDFFPRDPHQIIINLVVYFVNALLLCGFPLLSWVRKRPFDFESRLLLIYSAFLFVFFVLLTPMKAIIYPAQNRYLLPMVPATAVISAKSLIKEKPAERFIILVLQFIDVTLCALLMLLYPPFLSFVSSSISRLIQIFGITGE